MRLWRHDFDQYYSDEKPYKAGTVYFCCCFSSKLFAHLPCSCCLFLDMHIHELGIYLDTSFSYFSCVSHFLKLSCLLYPGLVFGPYSRKANPMKGAVVFAK